MTKEIASPALDACPHCGGTKGHWEGCRAPAEASAPAPEPVAWLIRWTERDTPCSMLVDGDPGPAAEGETITPLYTQQAERVALLESALKRIANMTDRDGNAIEMHRDELRAIAKAAL